MEKGCQNFELAEQRVTVGIKFRIYYRCQDALLEYSLFRIVRTVCSLLGRKLPFIHSMQCQIEISIAILGQVAPSIRRNAWGISIQLYNMSHMHEETTSL